MSFENSLSFAQSLDAIDKLKQFRNRFLIPKLNGKEVIYLAGNSLGLQPKTAREKVETEFKDWETLGVEGHLQGKNPWFYYHHFLSQSLAKVVGAEKEEVVAMNTLSVNLHLLMVSFYRPSGKRNKIIMEANAFPSDQYAIETQIRFHNLNPDECSIEIAPRAGEYTLRTEDILKTIDEHKDELVLLLFGGVNYLSGQLFDMKTITEAGHKAGVIVGFDLAHAAGNVFLQLHDWNVDFACWCSYKYLNSGPGGVGGIFVNERHGTNADLPRFAGWWGNDESTRFEMKKGFHSQQGAAGWQISNAQIFPMAIHRASLDIFDEAGIENLRGKSVKLTAYLEFIINEYNQKHAGKKLQIITPKKSEERGCQLSFIAEQNGKQIFEQLTKSGVVADWREPDVIRMAPVPLYNTFEDVFRLGQILNSL